MRPLARELRNLGYERTERESPFDEDGTLWTNSYELVCDKTAFVIRKDESRWTVGDDGYVKLKEQFQYGDEDED